MKLVQAKSNASPAVVFLSPCPVVAASGRSRKEFAFFPAQLCSRWWCMGLVWSPSQEKKALNPLPRGHFCDTAGSRKRWGETDPAVQGRAG